MFEHLLLLTAILLGMALLRLVRRGERGGRGYFLIVAVQLAITLVAISRGDRFLGLAAAGFCLLTVVMPWLLEGLSRRAFARGQLARAVRLAGLRSVLMPGAGLSRQQQVLRGLSLLEREGVDAALEYFRGLAVEVEDGGELAVIHEQIVSMLLYDQRWAEGIAHFEGQFHLRYAALRPVLALGLLRAYGEAGKLDDAAGLLRALEDGLGADPGAAEILGQARLTFLAYAGADSYVAEAVDGEHRESLGISRASGALFRGIALARAGRQELAVSELERVGSLAGPTEERLVRASKATLANLEDAAAEIAPELRRYAQSVGERLRSFLQTQRLPRRRGPVILTHALVALLGAGYVLTQVVGGAGVALLEAGAFTPELFAAGSWGRLFTASFVQTDLIGLLLDIYSVWLGGHVLERLPGRSRAALVALGGAAAGAWAAALTGEELARVFAGGSAMAIAVTSGALWSLLPVRTPGLAARARRSLLFTLGLLLAAQLLECVPGERGVVLGWASVVAPALVATLLCGVLPVTLPRLVNHAFALLAAGTIALTAYAGYKVAREDVQGFVCAHRELELRHGGVEFRVPWSFAAASGEVGEEDELPVYEGLIDAQARRDGHAVQLLVLDPAAGEPPASPLFELDPGLSLEVAVRNDDSLPDAVREALTAAPGPWTSHLLQRNGEVIARVIERRPAGDAGLRVLLLTAPAASLELAPRLYAEILAEAAPVE